MSTYHRNQTSKVNLVSSDGQLYGADNRLPVNSETPDYARGAYGEALVAEQNTEVSMKFSQGYLNTDLYNVLSVGAGSGVTITDSMAVLTNDTGVGHYCVLRSNRLATYKPAIGQSIYFSGTFDSTNAVANSLQLFGAGNASGGLFFGYNEDTFSVLRQTGGKQEIRSFEVTGAASTPATISITLNGTAYSVDVSAAAGDANFTAGEIAGFRDWDQDGWNVYQRDNEVIFEKRGVGAAEGSYSLDPTTSGITGSFTRDQAGASDTKNWTGQTNWNVDTMDGNGPSGMTLNPALNNLYKIQMQWLGAGNIKYYVANPDTGNWVLVHVDEYANTTTDVSLLQPDLFLQFTVASLGSTTSMTAKVGSAAVRLEGSVVETQTTKFFRSNNVTNIGSGTETPILTIRNNFVNASKLTSFGTVRVSMITASSDSTKPVVFKVRRNESISAGTPADYPDWQAVNANSICDIDTNSTSMDGDGRVLMGFIVGKEGSEILDLQDLDFNLNKGDSLTITAETTNGTNDITAGISWVELV